MISFIIPTYKNDISLTRCVQEIINNTPNSDFEVIVVDNFTSNEFIMKLYDLDILNLKIIKNPVIGAHHSRRLGLYNSIGEVIVFVDDDNYLTKDYISFLLTNFEEKAKKNFFIGCASIEYVNVDWKENGFSPFTFACGSLAGLEFTCNIPIYWGAGMAMNRDLAFEIFKENLIVEGRMAKKNYIMSGEDHEYSLRAFFAKAEFIYYEKIGLYHDFDHTRLNQIYYKKVHIGFAYAAYILKIYYDVYSKNKFYGNVLVAYVYNLLFAIGYNFKHPLELSSSLIIKDSVNFQKFVNRFNLVKSMI